MTVRLATDLETRSLWLLCEVPDEAPELPIVLRDRVTGRFLGPQGWTQQLQVATAQVAEDRLALILDPETTQTFYGAPHVHIEIPDLTSLLSVDWPHKPPPLPLLSVEEPPPAPPPPLIEPKPTIMDRLRGARFVTAALCVATFALGGALAATGARMHELQDRGALEGKIRAGEAALAETRSKLARAEANPVCPKVTPPSCSQPTVQPTAPKAPEPTGDGGLSQRIAAVTAREVAVGQREAAIAEAASKPPQVGANPSCPTLAQPACNPPPVPPTARETALQQREAAVVDAEKALGIRISGADQRDRVLSSREAIIETRERNLNEREARLSEKETNMRTPTPASPNRRDIWGAAAISQDGAFYIVANQVSEDAASRLAIASCNFGGSNSGYNRYCEIKTTFRKACISVARPSGSDLSRWSYATGATKQESDAEALALCNRNFRNCSVRVFLCSPDELWPYD